ncbi:MAG: hypothetical protein R2733_26110 [Acidimicrobiales bacterium]
MKINRAIALACACAIAPFTVAACGDSYDRTEFIDELVQTGATEEQATCITDRVEAEIGIDRLNSRGSDLTDEETQILTDATFDCMFGTDEG